MQQSNIAQIRKTLIEKYRDNQGNGWTSKYTHINAGRNSCVVFIVLKLYKSSRANILLTSELNFAKNSAMSVRGKTERNKEKERQGERKRKNVNRHARNIKRSFRRTLAFLQKHEESRWFVAELRCSPNSRMIIATMRIV